MDVTLAKEITALLAPALPYLIPLGKKAAEKAAEEIGKDTWAAAKMLWEKLWPKLEAKEAAREAVEDVAQTPTDAEAQVVLRRQIAKLLTEDPVLAEQLTSLTRTPLIQRVVAEKGSQIEDVEQAGISAEMEVIARDQSTIKGVRQHQR
jgi:hypothetical protein